MACNPHSVVKETDFYAFLIRMPVRSIVIGNPLGCWQVSSSIPFLNSFQYVFVSLFLNMRLFSVKKPKHTYHNQRF